MIVRLVRWFVSSLCVCIFVVSLLEGAAAQGLMWDPAYVYTYVNDVEDSTPRWEELGDKLTYRGTIYVVNSNVYTPNEDAWIRLRCDEASIDWDEVKTVWANFQQPLSHTWSASTGNHHYHTTAWTGYVFLFEWGTGNQVGQNRVGFTSISFDVD